jgi:hypothetical protein
MNKRGIRCYVAFVQVAPTVYNYPVYCMIFEGWSCFSLGTCISCGEIFVIDWENPATKGLSIKEVASINKCPTCGSLLKDTVKNYPESIKLPNGQVGTFKPDNYLPPDNETIVKDFYEIIPGEVR